MYLGSPASAWLDVKPSRGLGCDYYAQDYRQIFGNLHPDVPEPSKKGFIACYHVRYGLDEKYGCPVIYESVNEPRRGNDKDVLDSSWVV